MAPRTSLLVVGGALLAVALGAPQGWNVCDSTSYPCTTDAQCSEVWPTDHPNHWRYCDRSGETNACAAMECGTINGQTKRCPAGNYVCEHFKCVEYGAVDEECTNGGESDTCFGEYVSCFRNVTQAPINHLLQHLLEKEEPQAPALCERLDAWRDGPCSITNQCPSPLVCLLHPDGLRRCVDQVYLNAGDTCVGSNRDYCLGGLSRGVCRTGNVMLSAAKAELKAPAQVCQAKISTAPQCDSSTCGSHSQCESGYCFGGNCVDRALLLGEACVDGIQCISGYCVGGECVVNPPTEPPTDPPAQAGEAGVQKKAIEAEVPPPPSASRRVGDCSALSCQAGYYCSAADSEGESDIDFHCLPNCQGIGPRVWDPAISAYACQQPTQLANGAVCTNGHHNTCASGHCYTPATGSPTCASFAHGEAPLDTSCSTDDVCASGLCSRATSKCVAPGVLVQNMQACDMSESDQCDLGLFCTNSACKPMLDSSPCASTYTSYATECGNQIGNREPGVCLCTAEGADSRYKCHDKRTSNDLVLRGNPTYSWEAQHPDVQGSEFSTGLWDVFADAGCPSMESASKRAQFMKRSAKCTEQIFTRLTGAGVSLSATGPVPLGLSPYWMRRIVADLDSECRSHLADSVCCAACGLASGTAELPAVTKINTEQGRIWLSTHFQAFATPYVNVDCAARTVEPVWSECEASESAYADMTTLEWANSLSACTGINGGSTADPDSQGGADAMATWTAIAAAAGATIAAV